MFWGTRARRGCTTLFQKSALSSFAKVTTWSTSGRSVFSPEKVYEQKMYAAFKDKTADKCDFCLSRTAEGAAPQPACCSACVADARIFGTKEEIEKLAAESDRKAFRLSEENGTGPAVIYLPDVRY